MLTLVRRAKRGSHAAPRDPDESRERAARPAVSPGMLAIAASMSGERQMLAAGLTKIPGDELERLAKAARDLQVFAAAVLRTRDASRPPVKGFVLCLPCLLRDCRVHCGCTDSACMHRRERRPLGEPGDITRAMAAVPDSPAILAAPEPDGCGR